MRDRDFFKLATSARRLQCLACCQEFYAWSVKKGVRPEVLVAISRFCKLDLVSGVFVLVVSPVSFLTPAVA